MTDDRAPFRANRDAGLVKRHEQRLARARGGWTADDVERLHANGRCVEKAEHHHYTDFTGIHWVHQGAVAACSAPECHEETPEPVTDMVIPPEAREAARAAAIDRWMTGSADSTQMLLALDAGLEAALPHLRPMFELAGNLGRELGRREAAEEIAHRCELDATYDTASRYHFAKIAREIATKEPK